VEEAILNAPLRFLLLILAWQMPQHWFYKTINSDQFFYPQTPILAIHRLATHGIPSKQPEGPKLVKGQEVESLDRAAAVSERMPLFSEAEMGDFRSQWGKLQDEYADTARTWT
jgi:hypothetical protein